MRAKTAPKAAKTKDFEPTPIGNWVREVRESLHKTQAAFTEMIGAGEGSVQKWESGERRSVQAEYLKKILELATPAQRATCPVLPGQALEIARSSDPSVTPAINIHAGGTSEDASTLIRNELERRRRQGFPKDRLDKIASAFENQRNSSSVRTTEDARAWVEFGLDVLANQLEPSSRR